MSNPPVLLTADGKDTAGMTLALSYDGLALRLDLATDQELDSTCTLILKPAPGAGQSVGLETLNSTKSSTCTIRNNGIINGIVLPRKQSCAT
jgi:hypothetical protein